MKSRFEFTIIVPQSWDYRPVDLMKLYAKNSTGAKFYYYESPAILEVNGVQYKYEHWNIKKNNDGREIVTVYLIEK